MTVSRRRFLRYGSLAAMAGILIELPFPALAQQESASSAGFEIPAAAKREAFWHYRRSTFEQRVGEIFTAEGARGALVELKLEQVTDYKPGRKTRITTTAGAETECFTLVFEASSDLSPLSTTHAIEHPVLGRFHLFLVRSDAGSRIYYQAIINRLK